MRTSHSPGPDRTRCENAGLACAYALNVLPAREIAAAEAHIALCSDCRRELESLRPVLDRFVSWPTDVHHNGRGLILTWKEVGGPSVRAPGGHGFGSQLMNVCTRALSGTFDPQFPPQGFACSITFTNALTGNK